MARKIVVTEEQTNAERRTINEEGHEFTLEVSYPVGYDAEEVIVSITPEQAGQMLAQVAEFKRMQALFVDANFLGFRWRLADVALVSKEHGVQQVEASYLLVSEGSLAFHWLLWSHNTRVLSSWLSEAEVRGVATWRAIQATPEMGG